MLDGVTPEGPLAAAMVRNNDALSFARLSSSSRNLSCRCSCCLSQPLSLVVVVVVVVYRCCCC
ncbi:hypothetical protein BVRB_8g186910 isoform B [Beta vulgaris subsp. vulgaris]|nr:hypothetical protein BVRB_8g186910 isoform B [Beta vulgaris subsp. vulgaris]